MPTPHHINHIHKDDREENFFSLCFEHHVSGKNCPHGGSELLFIEWNRLTDHPKWRERYEQLKGKKDYQKKVDEIFNGSGSSNEKDVDNEFIPPPHNID
jgi:hypothetical protein